MAIQTHGTADAGRDSVSSQAGTPIPWPPRLQEGQQHLDPTDNDSLALVSLKHVTQELLNGLLPEGRGIKSKGPRARTPPGQVPP